MPSSTISSLRASSDSPISSTNNSGNAAPDSPSTARSLRSLRDKFSFFGISPEKFPELRSLTESPPPLLGQSHGAGEEHSRTLDFADETSYEHVDSDNESLGENLTVAVDNDWENLVDSASMGTTGGNDATATDICFNQELRQSSIPDDSGSSSSEDLLDDFADSHDSTDDESDLNTSKSTIPCAPSDSEQPSDVSNGTSFWRLHWHLCFISPQAADASVGMRFARPPIGFRWDVKRTSNGQTKKLVPYKDPSVSSHLRDSTKRAAAIDDGNKGLDSDDQEADAWSDMNKWFFKIFPPVDDCLQRGGHAQRTRRRAKAPSTAANLKKVDDITEPAETTLNTWDINLSLDFEIGPPPRSCTEYLTRLMESSTQESAPDEYSPLIQCD
ncbi:hypothetical protein F5Y19DRAFT_475685 [Xylariaceae sp. FL1651]|nr:hypothetical protein F5Y19DRAFT_475685 [Xylariaceae sp. FL1651]